MSEKPGAQKWKRLRCVLYDDDDDVTSAVVVVDD